MQNFILLNLSEDDKEAFLTCCQFLVKVLHSDCIDFFCWTPNDLFRSWNWSVDTKGANGIWNVESHAGQSSHRSVLLTHQGTLNFTIISNTSGWLAFDLLLFWITNSRSRTKLNLDHQNQNKSWWSKENLLKHFQWSVSKWSVIHASGQEWLFGGCNSDIVSQNYQDSLYITWLTQLPINVCVCD